MVLRNVWEHQRIDLCESSIVGWNGRARLLGKMITHFYQCFEALFENYSRGLAWEDKQKVRKKQKKSFSAGAEAHKLLDATSG